MRDPFYPPKTTKPLTRTFSSPRQHPECLLSLAMAASGQCAVLSARLIIRLRKAATNPDEWLQPTTTSAGRYMDGFSVSDNTELPPIQARSPGFSGSRSSRAISTAGQDSLTAPGVVRLWNCDLIVPKLEFASAISTGCFMFSWALTTSL